MERVENFLRSHPNEQLKDLVIIELRNKNDLYELYDIVTPPLEPLQSKEIAEFFTNREFSDDINQAKQLTTEKNEATFTISRWVHPMSFYRSPVVLNNKKSYIDIKKDRYPFFDFHSHNVGYTPLPSIVDLGVINKMTKEVVFRFKIYKEDLGELPENFDITAFRPIMGIGSFGWFSERDGHVSYNGIDRNFWLLLLQLKKNVDTNKFNFNQKIIKKYEQIIKEYKRGQGHYSILNAFKNLPYNSISLFYKWDEKNKKYSLSSQKELKKLGGFALEVAK